jgi:hypothetical protein
MFAQVQLYCREESFLMSVECHPFIASFDPVPSSGAPAAAGPTPLRDERLRSFRALAGGAAHELNNVLATILMSVELLRQSGGEQADRRVLSALEETTRRGLHTTRQLQLLARGSESGPALFQPRFLLADVQELMRAASPDSTVVVSEYPPDLPLLLGDPLAFHQLLLALLLEARDALGGSGTLALCARGEELAALACAGSGAAVAGPCLVIEVSAFRERGGAAEPCRLLEAAVGRVPSAAGPVAGSRDASDGGTSSRSGSSADGADWELLLQAAGGFVVNGSAGAGRGTVGTASDRMAAGSPRGGGFAEGASAAAWSRRVAVPAHSARPSSIT